MKNAIHMGDDGPESPGPRDVLLLHISNFYAVIEAFGVLAYQSIQTQLRDRLQKLPGLGPDWLQAGPDVFLELREGWSQLASLGAERYCRLVAATLSDAPILHENRAVLLRLEVWLTSDGAAPPSLRDAMHFDLTSADTEARDRRAQRYRHDMAAASALVARLRAGDLVFAFQPVVGLSGERDVLYWESLLRAPGDHEPLGQGSCEGGIVALERLGMVDRLDFGVIDSLLGVLQRHPGITLGCNVSAQSLYPCLWWRSLLGLLQDQPAVASRLVIEVTETSAISQDEAALALLSSLRRAGCRIALDDMGAGYSTLDFAVRAEPDFVKVDKAYLHPSLAGTRHTPQLLRKFVQLCAELAPHVILEGVETRQDQALAAEVGAGGLQGHLFGIPQTLPPWAVTEQQVRAPAPWPQARRTAGGP